MLKTAYLFTAFLLISILSIGQKKFPGYYINFKGDTIQGNFTSYKEKESNPDQLDFVSGGTTTTLTPQNCKRLSITGYDVYESRHFTRMLNPIELTPGFNESDPNNKFEEKDAFLRVVYEKNNVNLYEYKDLLRPNYFIQFHGDTLTELQNKVYLNNNVLVEERRYRNQLSFLFGNSISQNQKLQNTLEDLRYQPDALVSFINKAQNIKQEKVKAKYPFDLIVMGGASINSFDINPKNYSFKPSLINYGSSIAPVFGIGLNMYSRRNLGKNIFLVQLKYWSFKNSGMYSESADKYEFSFKSNVATLEVGVGRNWVNTQTISWYTNIAPVLSALIGDETKGNSILLAKYKDKILDFNLNFQTGVVIKHKLGIWGSYHVAGFDTRTFQYFRSVHRPLQIGVDWRFKL